MPKLTIYLVLSALTFAAQGSPLPEQIKRDFIKSGVRSCLVNQRQDPLSKYLKESQLNEYCNCAMTRASDFITLEDIRRVLQTKSHVHLVPVMETAGNYCSQMLIKKWGDTK
jgi:hypothetical protein